MSAEEEDQTKKVACSAEDVVNVRCGSELVRLKVPDPEIFLTTSRASLLLPLV